MENFYNFDFGEKYEKSKPPKYEHNYELKDIVDFLTDQKTMQIKRQNKINDIIFKIHQYIQDYVDFETKDSSDKYVIQFSITPTPSTPTPTPTADGKYVYIEFKFNNDKTIYSIINKNLLILQNIIILFNDLFFNYDSKRLLSILNMLLSFNYYINNIQVNNNDSNTEVINNPKYSDYSSKILFINENLKNIKTLIQSIQRCLKMMGDLNVDKSKLMALEIVENSNLVKKSLNEAMEELMKIQEIHNSLDTE